MGSMQRSKGARGEREAAALLSKLLETPVTRTRQFKGSPGSPDLEGVAGLHLEVKRTERLSLYDALAQAERGAGENRPLVLHKRNRNRWLFIGYLDDLAAVSEAIIANLNN